MNNLKTVLKSQLQSPPPLITNGVFSRVLQQVADKKYDSENTLAILSDFFAVHRLNSIDFPVMKQTYTRTMLLREKSGFEIMMARWDKGASTPIHGHPRYSFLYVIEGELSKRFFIRNNRKLMQVSTLNYRVGDYSYHNGDPDKFDNAIHKLTAMKNSLSLHVYSDDALKGEVFNIS